MPSKGPNGVRSPTQRIRYRMLARPANSLTHQQASTFLVTCTLIISSSSRFSACPPTCSPSCPCASQTPHLRRMFRAFRCHLTYSAATVVGLIEHHVLPVRLCLLILASGIPRCIVKLAGSHFLLGWHDSSIGITVWLDAVVCWALRKCSVLDNVGSLSVARQM